MSDAIAVVENGFPAEVCSALDVFFGKEKREAMGKVIAYRNSLEKQEEELEDQEFKAGQKVSDAETKLRLEIAKKANARCIHSLVDGNIMTIILAERKDGDVPADIVPIMKKHDEIQMKFAERGTEKLSRTLNELGEEIDAKLAGALGIETEISWGEEEKAEKKGKTYRWRAEVQQEKTVDLSSIKEMNDLMEEEKSIGKQLAKVRELRSLLEPYLQQMGF